MTLGSSLQALLNCLWNCVSRCLFAGLRRVLEALVIQENLEFCLLVKSESNHSTNRNKICPDLCSYLVG